MLARELVQEADDLVLHEAEPLGAAPAMPVLEQQLLGRGAPCDQRSLEALRDRARSSRSLPACALASLFEIGGDGARVEQFGVGARAVDR